MNLNSGLPLWLAVLLTAVELLPIIFLSVSMTIGLVSDGKKNGFTAGSKRVIVFAAILFVSSMWLLKCIWL